MKKTEKKSPFFAKLLEKQVETKDIKGGDKKTTKYPSDKDVIEVTMKYPSDGDDDIYYEF